MDIFEIYKKMKPKGAQRFLTVSAGQITAPQLGIRQICRTGVDAGDVFSVRLDDALPPGTTCEGLYDSDENSTLVFRMPNGAERRVFAEEGSLSGDPQPPPTDVYHAMIPHKKTLEWVSSAASKDAYRENLNGLRFDGTSLVATDGHRLHEARIQNGFDKPFTFPLAYVPVLALATEWHIKPDGSRSWLIFENGLFVSVPHTDSTYPDFRQVIPDVSKAKAQDVFDSKALLDAHKKAAQLVKKQAVQWDVQAGEMAIRIKSPDLNWETSVPVQSSGDFVSGGFNPKYIAELVKGTTGSIVCARTDDLAPALFGLPAIPGCEKRRAVVMPMRL